MVAVGLGVFETRLTIGCPLSYPRWLKDLNPGPCDLNSIQEIQVRRTQNLGGVLWRLQ